MILVAVNGWGIPAPWFRDEILKVFPSAKVKMISPFMESDKDPAETLSAYPVDLYLGYSMGSLWLMKNQKHLAPKAKKVLLAPFLVFPKEENLGGNVSKTQIKFLIRKLQRNDSPREILDSFYADAGLSIDPRYWMADLNTQELIRGLDYLLNCRAMPSEAEKFNAIAGSLDPLLDSKSLLHVFPNIQMVEKAGHSPGPLLIRISEII